MARRKMGVRPKQVIFSAVALVWLTAGAVAQEGGAAAAPTPGTSAPSATPALPPSESGGSGVGKLADCLVQHSGQPESDAMRKVMVAALSDDTPGLKSALAEFSGLLLKLSMASCGVGLSQLQDPAYGATFQQASAKYGSVLGAKLMQDAFAKLN